VDLYVDPYYQKKSFQSDDIEIVLDEPLRMNRRVTYAALNGQGRDLYNLGSIENREAIILFNLATQKTPAKTIEYFI